MLASVEREFGSQRFARVWTSAEPFEKAFEESFGVPVREWVHDWMQPAGRIYRGGRLSGTSLLLTLLFLGICVGAVLATAQRRRV